jgi:tetratricopeptide (TPR) repeat protein
MKLKNLKQTNRPAPCALSENRGRMERSFRLRGWLAALMLVAVTFAAYQPVWRAGYIWDDDVMLTGNHYVQSPGGLSAIWFSTKLPDYFPMTYTALWLQWRVWGGDPLGYHLVNVLLHALSAVLWCRVLARFRIPGAWLAAAIFALHPVNVESVAWVSEIKNTLAMFFFTLTLWAWGRMENKNFETQKPTRDGVSGFYWLALLFFAAALLSKAAVAPLPLVLLGLAWWRRGRIGWRDVRRILPFFVASAAMALVTIAYHHQVLGAVSPALIRDDGFWSRLAGAGWAIWFYFYKALLPVNLILVYPRWKIDAASALSYVPLLLLLAILLMHWKYRRQWGRTWLFALGYFIMMLLPVLGFLNVSYMRYSFVADRWQYFAILGPIALVSAGVSWKFEAHHPTSPRRKNQNSDSIRVPSLGIRVSIAALLLLLGALTWRQSRMYADAETVWETTLGRNPNCAIFQNEVGNSLARQGRVDEAIVRFEKALEATPDYEPAHYNLGCAMLEKGRPDLAIARFRRALEIHPAFVDARYNLGNTLLEQGDLDQAIACYRKVLELRPDHSKAENNLAVALLRKGELREAIPYFEKALARQPENAQAHNNLGWCLLSNGQPEEAIPLFRKALELQPDLTEARENLEKALLRCGKQRGIESRGRTEPIQP